MNAHEPETSWPDGVAESLDHARLSVLTALSDEEVGVLAAGIERLDPVVAHASRTIIESWGGLDGPQRLAALVALAEALANSSS